MAVPAALLLAIVVAGLLAPVIAPYSEHHASLDAVLAPYGSDHLLGGDVLGAGRLLVPAVRHPPHDHRGPRRGGRRARPRCPDRAGRRIPRLRGSTRPRRGSPTCSSPRLPSSSC
ncbi:hypothetical protein ACU686_10175 [Yinghuangia aomiensis]